MREEMLTSSFYNSFILQLSPTAADHFRTISRLETFKAGNRFQTGTDDLYFIEKGVVSVINDQPRKEFAEVMSFGPESIIGLTALYTDMPPQPMIWLVRGKARIVQKKAFLEMVNKFPELRKVCDSALGAFMSNLFASASCFRNHEVDGRLVTAILTTHDRCGETFFLTQDRIALHLDISRTLVNGAAGRLAAKGLIKYNRGYICILNKAELSKLSCSCYQSRSDL